MKVLVFIEQRDGKLKKNAFEALTVAARIAGSTADLAAVLVGGKVAGMAKDLQGYGADRVFVVENDSCEKYNAWLNCPERCGLIC